MLGGKKRPQSSSFGNDGRRLNSGGSSCVIRKHISSLNNPVTPSNQNNPTNENQSLCTSKNFQSGIKCIIQRAPLLNGLSVSSGVYKKFKRPMTKRRAYTKVSDEALKQSSLGVRRRMDGMSKLLARAGKGLFFKLPNHNSHGGNTDGSSDGSDDERDTSQENNTPFEPLLVWTSPHQGGEAKGLPSQVVPETHVDEYGIEETVTVLKAAPLKSYSTQNVFVPPVLAKWLRPHQREGVQFMYECVMGLKPFNGYGCILADDMGLGKTLQSVSLIYTLLKTGITSDGLPTCKRVIIVCPCSLVKNWDNEFSKWLGPGVVKTLALAESDKKSVEKNIDIFVKTKMFNVLIVSYETIRMHIGRLSHHKDCCDILVCDEAHRLKNSDNQTSRALDSIPVKRRVLLTGTPMQNNLEEFFAMVDFTNPGVLAPSVEDFRRNMLAPILRGREPDATEAQKKKMMQVQMDISCIVNDFILRRVNTLNAEHLPPKLVQVVCCNLTSIQQNMYQQIVAGKDMKHVLDGKQENCLGYIQVLMKLCNHPSLIIDNEDRAKEGRRAAARVSKYSEEEEKNKIEGSLGLSKFLPFAPSNNAHSPVFPEWSGKMFVLYRLMKEMRKPGNGNDKIVIISNYTQTLDLIGKMCRESSWGFCRLDGGVNMKKRQKMVDEFNDPQSSLVAFLLSSKAGGCGINLIGGNRLVLFDPDWNPAVDAQAAARCWRDGQKKRCFTYRFLATGTLEEKIFQRQLAKQGLQQVVDDKEQVNALSSKDLRNLFKLRHDTPSDTHDKLKCERCRTITDDAEIEARKLLPKKLSICLGLVDKMLKEEDASFFATPIIPSEHGVSKDDYESKVKQPIDLGTVRSKLEWLPDKPSGYESISGFSKDLNRVFANVLKVWAPGSEIAEAARRLQAWWIDEWTQIVPTIMSMKSDNDEPNLQDQHQESNGTLTFSESNERGDNYQEQIGLPDEEDMRCWSHHHSVDTVDDPVFRAAMRGYDSVSFVFGLEVTWSLIQQRKQEEEEKLAMLEFEEAQKCEGGTNHSENSGDERDITPSVKDEESDGELCCTPQDLGCNKIIKDGMSESDASSEGHFPDLSIQVENEENGESSESGMKNTGSLNGDWICVSCTYSNISTRKTCAMCKAKRADVEGDSRWECPSCTYKNPESKRSCVMCKLRRGSPNKKQRCR